MKVIANRFKHIFPKIIAQEQTGFIAERNINENIILAQEVVHSMRCQKKRKWMAIKINLEKAYDRVMWNGVLLSKFSLVRGIRQGCPLSPYLFVLCMEWLGHLIQATISEAKWNPIRLSRDVPDISHLFFVDDLSMMIPRKTRDEIERHIPPDVYMNYECLLHKMVTEDGSWNLDLFRVWLSDEVIQAIKGIPSPYPLEGPDRISWNHIFSSAFSVKSAYKAIKGGDGNPNDEKWEMAWKFPGPQWIQDIFHILRDCPATKDVWAQALQFFSSSQVVPSGCLDQSVKVHTSEEEVHLYTNRAVQLDSRLATVGGVVHDTEGHWYIPRNQNQVADCVAKLALIEKGNLQVLDFPSEMARVLIDRDKYFSGGSFD
ncbi:hypothetical protein PVK06_047006 [Gossypium arboreum]|uniref:Reverse transcriptase domain-containing protein n=1 Tax=Gossypium arboreum TaxID=29729 RepID=A0ABR0MC74_GOSAR|nr:hypothetical protein PVK06_047006 [Gossypium arboreum]